MRRKGNLGIEGRSAPLSPTSSICVLSPTLQFYFLICTLLGGLWKAVIQPSTSAFPIEGTRRNFSCPISLTRPLPGHQLSVNDLSVRPVANKGKFGDRCRYLVRTGENRKI